MFDRLEITLLPPGHRFPTQLRLLVNGEDVVEPTVGSGGCGPLAASAFPADRPSLLQATPEPRRVQLGEPECTGGCCGYLSVVVERVGNVVQWTDWEIPFLPHLGPRPPSFDFVADEYGAVLARARSAFSAFESEPGSSPGSGTGQERRSS
jgi:hypothetical protein